MINFIDLMAYIFIFLSENLNMLFIVYKRMASSFTKALKEEISFIFSILLLNNIIIIQKLR